MKLMRFDKTNKLAYKAVRVKEAQKYGLSFLCGMFIDLLGRLTAWVCLVMTYRWSLLVSKRPEMKVCTLGISSNSNSTHPNTIGIWTKTIQRKTELPQTVVNKCIKTLESQAIIKNIKAVKVCASPCSNYVETIAITKLLHRPPLGKCT